MSINKTTVELPLGEYLQLTESKKELEYVLSNKTNVNLSSITIGTTSKTIASPVIIYMNKEDADQETLQYIDKQKEAIKELNAREMALHASHTMLVHELRNIKSKWYFKLFGNEKS